MCVVNVRQNAVENLRIHVQEMQSTFSLWTDLKISLFKLYGVKYSTNASSGLPPHTPSNKCSAQSHESCLSNSSSI